MVKITKLLGLHHLCSIFLNIYLFIFVEQQQISSSNEFGTLISGKPLIDKIDTFLGQVMPQQLKELYRQSSKCMVKQVYQQPQLNFSRARIEERSVCQINFVVETYETKVTNW